MAIIKSIVSALATYSKVPMPTLNYKEGEGRFTLCFFPLVGVIIAALEYLAFLISWCYGVKDYMMCIVYGLIPVVITGGIHLDGFMDSMDAIHSYGDREKKLEILSDPHVGAFCIIKLLELVGIWMFLLMGMLESLFGLLIFGFILSRIFSGISILRFDSAKDTGMVAYTRAHSSKACFNVLILELIACILYLYYEFDYYCLLPIASMIICFFIYKFKVRRDFGGITGDTAGCFLVMSETAYIGTTVLIGVLLRI